MASGRNEPGPAITAIALATSVPCDVSAQQAPARGSGTLTRDEGEFLGGLREGVEIRDRADEGGEARGGGGETRGGGEVVGGDYVERVGG